MSVAAGAGSPAMAESQGLPPQPYTVPAGARNPLAPMDYHEKTRYRTAAFHAKRIYPGPVGELVAREILTWEEFGYRTGQGRLMSDLVDHIMKTPLP